MPPVTTRTPLDQWKHHVARWRECRECPLCDQRYRTVLGRGTVPCDVLFVGEAPGENENLIGQPFVGPAGNLLDDIVDRSVGAFNRERAVEGERALTTAYTNLVACFPAEAKQTKNHQPAKEEIAACQDRLREMIAICRPRLIVAVGSLADENIPLALDTIVYSGGRVQDHPTVRHTISILHPSYILSRLPLAQKGMAVQKIIVNIRTALEGQNWD